jgi:6-phosphogluconolactonase (cycloisomerase 2 family)
MSRVLAVGASRSFKIVFAGLLGSFLLGLICSGCATGMGAASSSETDQIAINVISPASGVTEQGTVNVSVQVTASSPVTTVTLALDSASVGQWSSASVQTTINPSSGRHQLTVNASDQSGNSAQKSVSFQVARNTLNVIWPANGASLPSPVFVNAVLPGNNANATLALSADGAKVASSNGATIQTYVPLAAGQHTLVVSSRDSSGVRQQQILTVTVPITRYVLVMNDDATVSSFAFNIATGQLTPQGTLALPGAGTSMTDGMVREGSGNLDGFSDCDGGLSSLPVQGFSGAPTLPIGALAALDTPGCPHQSAHTRIYESAAGGNYIRGFEWDRTTDAGFTELQNSPFTTAGGTNPIASPMAFTPNGKFGYLANPASRAVETFSIDGSGNLQSQGLSPAKQDAAYTQLDPTGELLYVTSADSNLLSIFQVNQNTGALKLAGEPLVVAQNAAPKIVSTGRYVYVQDVGQNPINIYRADAVSGTLQLLGQTSASYQLLAADPSGHFLFTAVQETFSGNLKQNLLIVLQISPVDGSLTQTNSARLRGTNLPTVITSGMGRTPVSWGIGEMYVSFAGANGTPDQIIGYSADPIRGVVSANWSSTIGAGEHVASMTVPDSRAIIEAVDQNGNGTLSTAFYPFASAPISAPSADLLSASANHRNAYFRGCTQCGNDQWNVAYWSYDPNRNAAMLQYSAATLSGVRTLAADPLDQFLFATIDANGGVTNKSFLLDPNTGAPSLQNVDWITFEPAYAQAVDPTGKIVLSVDANDGIAITYRIEADGNMDWMSQSTFSGTRGIFDPTGRYVIGVNAIGALDPEQGPGQIYVYQIGSDGIEGSLTQVAGPYSTPNTPRDFAMDAAGKFLYVLNGGAVSIFSFDEQTGTMQESPFSPESIAPASAPVATTIAIQNQKN